MTWIVMDHQVMTTAGTMVGIVRHSSPSHSSNIHVPFLSIWLSVVSVSSCLSLIDDVLEGIDTIVCSSGTIGNNW